MRRRGGPVGMLHGNGVLSACVHAPDARSAGCCMVLPWAGMAALCVAPSQLHALHAVCAHRCVTQQGNKAGFNGGRSLVCNNCQLLVRADQGEAGQQGGSQTCWACWAHSLRQPRRLQTARGASSYVTFAHYCPLLLTLCLLRPLCRLAGGRGEVLLCLPPAGHWVHVPAEVRGAGGAQRPAHH